MAYSLIIIMVHYERAADDMADWSVFANKTI